MSRFQVKKVAVLGAGVMGAQIAAHLVNVQVPVVLFDLAAKEGAPNGVVDRAIERLRKLRPAPLAVQSDAADIVAANYDQNLEWLRECDLIIEAIAERLDWKLDLYERIAPYVPEHAIVASNTSGLSISRLADVLPEAIRPRFCGIHFFNPPRYMHLVELIGTPSTRPDILDQLETFVTTSVGKGVVRAHDTPNFVANRVGVAGMLAAMTEAERFGLTPDVVDDLTGKKLGRASSGTYRTSDVVGLDTMEHVIKTMTDGLPDDPFHALYAVPAAMADLIARGALGQKSGAGYFKKVGREILRYDQARADYVPGGGKADDDVVSLLKLPPAERLGALRASANPQAQYLWAILRDIFHYGAVHLADVADSARDIDFALRWGFGWSQGPFELWQQAGWKQVAEWIRQDIEAGTALAVAPLPAWVFDGRDGVHTAQGSWSAAQQRYLPLSPLPVYERQPFRENVAGATGPNPASAGTTCFEDESLRLWTSGNDVLVATLKTKMHTLGRPAIDGLARAVELAEKEFSGLVLWSPAAPFSAGFDLKAVLAAIAAKGPSAVESDLLALQQLSLKLRYANVPTVAAVHGMALGGGAELALHCTRRVFAMESVLGLVEFKVGLLPAGGGLTWLARQAAARAAGGSGGYELATGISTFLAPAFANVVSAQISTSARDAFRLGYAQAADPIVPNPGELLFVAMTQARSLFESGYRPDLRARIRVAGRPAKARFSEQLGGQLERGEISAFDHELGLRIADVLSGGDVDENTVLDESALHRLEARHFIELLAEPKTIERIEGMLKTGKPVKN